MVKMRKSYWAIMLLIIFLCSVFILLGAECARAEDEGEITVHNETDRDLYISIAGRNKGVVATGQEETYSCKYGTHRVTAEWEDGSVSKYITVSRTYPSADWYISQDDVE